MKLRHKFGMLALLYAVTLAANVGLCSWCLLLYYQSFLNQAADGPSESILTPPPGSDPHMPPAAVEENVASQADRIYLVRILLLNAACGVAIGVLGLMLVRRWVIEPVAALRDAAVKIGQGDLAYPVQSHGKDELGELAGEVKSMASSIVTMQQQLIEQERRQMAFQALRCIIHNIRSPLTGIRWVAEAVGMRTDVDADTAREQRLIVREVDETLNWLQDYRESLSSNAADAQKQEKQS
jgi:HAMP domain-containing protein